MNNEEDGKASATTDPVLLNMAWDDGSSLFVIRYGRKKEEKRECAGPQWIRACRGRRKAGRQTLL